MSHNQMAIHSFAGCVQSPNVAQSGQTIVSNCNDTSSSGCTVAETKPNSYGPGFADAKGGVFALQFDVAGVFMWFWSVRIRILIYYYHYSTHSGAAPECPRVYCTVEHRRHHRDRRLGDAERGVPSFRVRHRKVLPCTAPRYQYLSLRAVVRYSYPCSPFQPNVILGPEYQRSTPKPVPGTVCVPLLCAPYILT